MLYGFVFLCLCLSLRGRLDDGDDEEGLEREEWGNVDMFELGLEQEARLEGALVLSWWLVELV